MTVKILRHGIVKEVKIVSRFTTNTIRGASFWSYGLGKRAVTLRLAVIEDGRTVVRHRCVVPMSSLLTGKKIGCIHPIRFHQLINLITSYGEQHLSINVEDEVVFLGLG